MSSIPISFERREASEAFMAELARLRREVREVNAQLDRIETDLRRALDDLVRDRFESYR